MNYKEHAILWDVDGTLADSEPLHDLAMIESLKEFGVFVTSTDEVLGMSRPKVHEYLSKKYDNMPSYQEYTQAADEFYFQNRAQIKPMYKAINKCIEFANLGVRQAAVSNSEPHIVTTTLEQVRVKEYLDVIITCDGLGNPKPHSDPYLRAIDNLNVKKENAIVFEDSAIGCQAAINAGIFVIGVSKIHTELGANLHMEKVPDISVEELFELVK